MSVVKLERWNGGGEVRGQESGVDSRETPGPGRASDSTPSPTTSPRELCGPDISACRRPSPEP